MTVITSQEQRIICMKCSMAGNRSKVYITKMQVEEGEIYYDEIGRFHNHSKTVGTTAYKCEFGHEWETELTKKCWCGWMPGKDDQNAKK
jgi:hypothetical protein